jgi:biopolymer transport protein ExbB/TolQ
VNKSNRIAKAVMRSPILWGLAASAAFFTLVHAGLFGSVVAPRGVIPRYCIGHPVAYLETVMFFLGMAALVLKAVDIAGQQAGLRRPPLGDDDLWNDLPDDPCESLLDHLDRLPERRQQEFYVGRLRAALEHMVVRGSADDLEDELKYLADTDAARVHASYGLFRLLVWAIPILGFLGTVIGITMALNGVDLQAPDQSMVHVLTGLGLKFDTTALALTLSMVLMFVHFLVDRSENALLERVDRQVLLELSGRFSRDSAGGDGQVAAVRRMSETVIRATERLVERQAEVWQASIEASQERWSRLADDAGAQLQSALSESLKVHAREITAADQAGRESSQRQWGELQQALSQSVLSVTAAQEAMVRRVEVLSQAVEATSQIARLEETLNHNLAALAGAKNFEETVMSLAAAIHLLTARSADSPTGAKVRLESPRRATHAA